MTFYEKIIQELERAEQSLSTVYSFAFRFRDEALFEWDELEEVRTLTYGEAQQRIESATGALHGLLSDYPKGSPIGIYLPNGPEPRPFRGRPAFPPQRSPAQTTTATGRTKSFSVPPGQPERPV